MIRHTISTMVFFVFSIFTLMADPPAPPTPGGTPIGVGTPVGAPLDNGVLVLLAMGVLYGILKLYQHRFKHHDVVEEK
jgi:hypothetical protein